MTDQRTTAASTAANTAVATSAPPTIRIHPADNVVIARRQLLGGTVLADEGGLMVSGLVPPLPRVMRCAATTR